MRIVVDMDEVLCQFVGKVLKRWNAINGTKFSREDITAWRMENILGNDILGRTAEGLIDEWMSEPGFYEDLEPVEGAIDGLQKLMDDGHDIVICTSVPEVAIHAYDGKRKWMRRNFPRWSMKNFIACSRKGLIAGDVFIDDGPHNIRDWCAAGKRGAFVMDAPWNKDLGYEFDMLKTRYVSGMPITRVYDWQHILVEIERYMKDVRRPMVLRG